MALATWWYEDGYPALAPALGIAVESPQDEAIVARMAELPPAEVARRRDEGHRPYVAFVEGEAAAYGWVATRSATIGELNLTVDLPPGNRYLWDFATLPPFRGRGLYPTLLAEIVRRECPPATRLWIIHAPENLPSGVGITRAGFVPVAQLSFGAGGQAALASIGPRERVEAGAALLGLPIVGDELDPCWACGGCSCDHSHGVAGSCACATVPAR